MKIVCHQHYQMSFYRQQRIPVQCFAGYCDVKYGDLLEGEKQKGVIVNTCKEFNLLPPHKGDPLIRATPPT